jgi:acyl-CoA hydrolase
MEIEVEVHSEDPLSGEHNLTTCPFVTMVAVDTNARPTRVPSLTLLDEEERRRVTQAENRRAKRLAAHNAG